MRKYGREKAFRSFDGERNAITWVRCEKRRKVYYKEWREFPRLGACGLALICSKVCARHAHYAVGDNSDTQGIGRGTLYAGRGLKKTRTFAHYDQQHFLSNERTYFKLTILAD